MVCKSIILIVISALCVSESLRPRGVPPDMAHFYDPNSSFHCLDGSGEIPFDHVNDDYCDCKDGSDEPGTAACPNGRFYCANRGFKPSLIPSSRVNDGICDCCDGGDEWAQVTGIPCQNNCDELGAADRVERERLEKLVQEGLKMKAELAARGLSARKEKEAEIQTKKAELDEIHKEKEAKRLIKEEREKVEKAALDVIREEEDKARQEREEKERVEKEAEAIEHFFRLDANQDGLLGKEEIMLEIAFDQNNDGMISDEEATFYLSGHHSYDKDSFLSTGWLLMKHLFSKYENANKKKDNIDTDDIDDQDTTKEFSDDSVDDDDYDYDEFDDGLNRVKPDEEEDMDVPEKWDDPSHDEESAPNDVDEKPKSQYPPEVQALVDSANVARGEYDTANNAYNDLNYDIQQLEKYLEKDFGPDDVFASIANQCFEFNDLEYTYKMCAFDYCAQKPKHGGSETRLGSWEKWSEPHVQMSYERGIQCWNGPSRSTKVDLRCGGENKLVAASEPNRCEYLFLFETPAACQPLPPIQHDEL